MALTARVLTDQSMSTAAVDDVVDDIYDLENSTLTLQETGGSVTTDGTEQTLYIVDGPLGVFNPVCVLVSLDAMAAGADSVTFRVYYRIAAGAGFSLCDVQTFTGVDGGLANNRVLISIDLLPNRFGVQVTLQRVGGSDRDFPWEVFEEA